MVNGGGMHQGGRCCVGRGGAGAAVNVAAFRSVAGIHTKTAFSSDLYVHFGRFCPGQREMYIREQTFS